LEVSSCCVSLQQEGSCHLVLSRIGWYGPRAASQARSLGNGIWKRCRCDQSEVLHVTRTSPPPVATVSMIAAPKVGRSHLYMKDPAYLSSQQLFET
ncbi:hypothetical protein KCU61_g704, partial [Aureobasidium melanogenum]